MGSFGGFNFVYGDYRNYTKSAGTTSDIERLYFTGFHQHFFWNDANTCKQYIGIRDNFDYNGKDANVSRTSDFFYCNGIIRLNCPTSSTQSISSITAGTLRVNANNNNCVYNIINSSCPNFSFNGSATGCSINITNHYFC